VTNWWLGALLNGSRPLLALRSEGHRQARYAACHPGAHDLHLIVVNGEVQVRDALQEQIDSGFGDGAAEVLARALVHARAEGQV
jgi:hypothetical protein